MTDSASRPSPGPHLHSGSPQVVRGGADVRWIAASADAASEQPQSESTYARWRPASVALPAEEIAASGLFQERLIEFVQTAEEPVVSTRAVVREELVVRRTIEEHERTIEETVRRTGVDIEETRSDSMRLAHHNFARGASRPVDQP
jgi:hypothetical protein